jgi:hypothetical protein
MGRIFGVHARRQVRKLTDVPFWLAVICLVAADKDYQVSMFGFRFEPAPYLETQQSRMSLGIEECVSAPTAHERLKRQEAS